MSNSTARAKYETQLGRAHRSLFWAVNAARAMGDEGAAQDCEQILSELSRLNADSLDGRKRRREDLSGQLTIPLQPDVSV